MARGPRGGARVRGRRVAAVAVVGFEPRSPWPASTTPPSPSRWCWRFALVFRLGAGPPRARPRGLVVVVFGGLVLAVALAVRRAAAPLRRPTPRRPARRVHWMRTDLGAAPRPIEAFLGVPALVWGVTMRARRRQGWWVCAFGVTATAPVAHLVMDPGLSLAEAGAHRGLHAGRRPGPGLPRDPAGPGGDRSRGRGARRAEEATAIRPEPGGPRPCSDSWWWGATRGSL